MPIWSMPDACWASSRASASRKASANSLTGTRRFMDVSPERLVEQANERFQLQDYYGAIHLLEEVIATGRAFADAHHLLGLSYSLAGQPDKALEQLDRALALNPRWRRDDGTGLLARRRWVGGARRLGAATCAPAGRAEGRGISGAAVPLGRRAGWRRGGGQRYKA